MTRINCFSLSMEIERANSLLKNTESEVPQSVLSIVKFCHQHQIGFILSRNIKVLSCKDARSHRLRLGHVGIPLFDELKSIVFAGRDINGGDCVIAAHCRGHMNINIERLAGLCALSEKPEILPEERLKTCFGMELGTVNPVLLNLNSKGSIINVFDVSLTEPMAMLPGTMMTNAGNHTWGIEIDPTLLISAIDNKKVGSIAEPDKELSFFEVAQSTNPKSIGIITGNGPDSGIALWNKINEYFVKLLSGHFIGDISLPKVSVISLPAMGLSMELDKRNSATWDTILEAVGDLHCSNVDLLALACHTTHFYTNKIRDIFEKDGKKFISMPEVTIEYIMREGLTNISVIGIDFVANLREYSPYSELKNLNIDAVPSEVLSEFHKIGYEVKKKNNLHPIFQKFTNLVKNNIEADNVVIALTELSILYESLHKHTTVKNIIDPLDIYAREIVRQSLSL